jgi:ATP-dependent helicase/DNAse subunit B
MSRTLLLGRAGAGKTQRVVAAVRAHLDAHDAQGRFERFQVLVPTYSQAEHLKRRLLRGDDGLEALLDRGIGTFEQYAERETGIRLRALAPATVRDALVHAALVEDDFPDFRAVRRFPGFRKAVLRFVKEVKAAEPEPGADPVVGTAERLQDAAAGLSGAAARKLEGMARALAGYQRRLDASGLLDHEDLLRRLLVVLRESPPEGLRLFAVDGFTDLTEVQERIVQLVAGGADESLITLLGDPAGERAGPFAASAGLLGRLVSGSGFAVEALSTPRRFGGDLLRVERRAGGEVLDPAPPDGSVRLLAGADPADEGDRVARTCLRWIAEGVPRSDVLVVVRRLDGETADRVLDALRRHRVPHRRGGGAPLASVPAAASALRVLRLLAGTAAGDDLRDALRSGDARGVPDGEADRLHAIARPAGARSATALAAVAEEHGLAGVTSWLDRLDAARPATDPAAAEDVARALLAALPELLSWSFEGDVTAAQEARAAADAAALRKLRGLVGEIVRALAAAGRSAVSPAELLGFVDAAAADVRTSIRDQRVDVVNVVDAEEARQWEAEAVVVAGLRMGEFPSGAREDLFVADRDRDSVEKRCGVRLPRRLDEALRRERLLFYSAVTRARSRLVLTTPVADGKGDPVLPSPFLESLREIFPEEVRAPEGAGRTPGDVRPEPGEAFGLADALRSALAALGERHRPGGEAEVRAHAGLALVQGLVASERAELERAARSRIGADARVVLASEGDAAGRMAVPGPRSASSLATFRQCPYMHFAQKGLELAEPETSPEDGLDRPTEGDIAHRTLEAVYRDGPRTEERAGEVFDAVWSETTARLPDGVNLAGQRAALRHAVVSFVVRDAADPLVPGFAPSEQEWAFGMRGGPDVVVGDGDDRVSVRGSVDRLDVDDAGRAIVVDYKWSVFGRYGALGRRIEAGEDLQLPLYALAVQRAQRRDVVAAGYLTLRDGRTRWVRLADDAPRGGRGKSDVDWTDDPASRLADVERQVVALDAAIRSGDVDVRPLDPDKCVWCAYRDLCRVDERSLP